MVTTTSAAVENLGRQRLRVGRGEVDSQLAHHGDHGRIDLDAEPAAGGVRDHSALRAEGYERGGHLAATGVPETHEQDIRQRGLGAVCAGHCLEALAGESVRERREEVVHLRAVDQLRDRLVHHFLDRRRGVDATELVGEIVDRPHDVLPGDRVELVDRGHRGSVRPT